MGYELDSFRMSLTEDVLQAGEECATCEFFPECGGYFKWPDRSFSCDGVKRVLIHAQFTSAIHRLHRLSL
jgi:hypothetical protein